MERRSFDAALIAAAKVALGGALFGCEAQVVILGEEQGPLDEAGGAGGGSYLGRLPDAAVEEVCAMPDEPAKGWAVFDADTFACCVARVEVAAPTDPTAPGATWAELEPDESWVSACCAQILAENYEAIWSDTTLAHPAPDQVVTACCVHQHGDVGCTPWGPPAPPEMDGEDPTEPTPWRIA